MLRKIETPRYEAFLAGYRIPGIVFESDAGLPASLRPVWTALQADAAPAARRNAELALSEDRLFSAEEKAGLLTGLAAAQLRMGSTEDAAESIRKSLTLFPEQIAGSIIHARILSSRRDYEAAYELVAGLESPELPAAWDIRYDEQAMHIAMASFSWLQGRWERVSEHIQAAYPDGLESMPDEIQEDWFRLALYQDQPEEAARAAAYLIQRRPVALADEILQTIVQNGWTAEALPLYQDAFGREPSSELLRRRLVALCIKEGQLDEARRLTAPGALRTAA